MSSFHHQDCDPPCAVHSRDTEVREVKWLVGGHAASCPFGSFQSWCFFSHLSLDSPNLWWEVDCITPWSSLVHPPGGAADGSFVPWSLQDLQESSTGSPEPWVCWESWSLCLNAPLNSQCVQKVWRQVSLPPNGWLIFHQNTRYAWSVALLSKCRVQCKTSRTAPMQHFINPAHVSAERWLWWLVSLTYTEYSYLYYTSEEVIKGIHMYKKKVLFMFSGFMATL